MTPISHNYKIYSVPNYAFAKKDANDKDDPYRKHIGCCGDLKTVLEALEEDKSYHLRIIPGATYTFFIDLDGYKDDIDEFIDEKLVPFLKEKYGLQLQSIDVSYTVNSGDNTKYHLAIPKFHAKSTKFVEIMENFKKYLQWRADVKIIDVSVYGDKWFRLPQQTKGLQNKNDGKASPHKIEIGEMKDFLSSYIPEDSKNIDDIQYIDDEEEAESEPEPEKKPKKKEKLIKNNLDGEDKDKNKFSEKLKKAPIRILDDENNENDEQIELDFHKKLFDLLTKEYYTKNEYWYKLLMAARRHEKNTGIPMLEIFKDFSKKGKDTYDEKELLEKWKYYEKYDIKITLKILHEYAKECNLQGYYSLCREYSQKKKIDITDKYLANKIKEMAGHLFFYKKNELYCFDVENNFWYVNNDDVLKKYINTTLYDNVIHFLIDAIPDPKEFDIQKRELRKKCLNIAGQKDVVEGFRIHFGRKIHEDIEFDDKHYLFGFNNGVVDLRTKEFRIYRYDDYVTISCGYNYQEPTKEEVSLMSQIMSQIEPKKDKSKLLFQILGTCLIGMSYQKFVLFNGEGSNGKSLIMKLLTVVLGKYYHKGNIMTLCGDEKNAQSANVDVANMHNKRLVSYSEPAKKFKIRNGAMKSYSGDGRQNARQLYSSNDVVRLICTIILECNHRIFLEEEPTDAEIRRIIDFLFESKFTENDNDIDEEKRIFKANPDYLKDEFINKHKFAFLHLLINAAHEFLTIDKDQFVIPDEVRKRSEEYIAGSYFLLNILKETVEKTNDKNDFIKISDLYDYIKNSDYYNNLTKEERRKISKKEMIEFYEKNKYTSKDYKKRHQPIINGERKDYSDVLLGFKMIINENII